MSGGRAALDRSRTPEPGPLRELVFPHVARSGLGNGMRVLTAPHGRLPLVRVNLVLRTGADAEPAGKGGLAHLVAESLEGGTERRGADELAWALELLGAELSLELGWDATSVGMTVHRDRVEEATELLADIVRAPAFPEEEVRRRRELQLASLLQREKDPGALANDAAAHFVFGPDVPYGRPLLGLRPEVEGLTREDVRGFYRQRWVPSVGALLFVGDVRDEAARAAAERHFGNWAGEEPAAAEFEPDGAVAETTLFVVDRPGAVQSEIRIGDVGVARSHPDYFALLVMNTVLGGAFTSRLNMSLRERHGFTYGARSGFSFRRLPGPFSVDAAVGTEVTAAAVREALAEVRALREDGATEEEVAAARDYLAGVLPLRLQTVGQVAARLADLFIYGLPEDYLREYPQRIQAVSAADVRRVARERLRPERLAIVVVGDASQITAPLEELGLGPVRVERVGNTA
ncbi:MAG TPA: pitrilysin family protein [Longimicrobiales bacterium]|nr:pitrilysin family protein [Longimicrobiales bacterium]